MNQQDLRTDVVSKVRSCLISTKGSVTLRQLETDYRTLIGERIPFAQLGFDNMISFLQSEPSLILTRSSEGQFFVDAKISSESAHISSMVNRQKHSNPKKKFMPPRLPVAPQKVFNGGTVPKWRPKTMPVQKPAQGPVNPRLSQVSHNQFVQKPSSNLTNPTRNIPPPNQLSDERYKKPLVPSKIVIPEKSTASLGQVSRQFPIKKVERVITPDSHDNGFEEPCSPLASTKKRLTKLMAEIDLDRDSGTSSPTSEYVVPPKLIPDFIPTGDSIADLKNFVNIYKLGEPDIKFIKTKPKYAKTQVYYCRIKIGEQLYSSYPNDLLDEASAERFTSQKALDELIPKHVKRRSLLISGNEDVIDRIPPMLEKHQSTLWSTQIERDYCDIYNEQLPANWLQVVDSSPFVSIEKCPRGHVLKYCKPGDVLQKGKKLDTDLADSDVSVPSNTIYMTENGRIDALITAVTSACEIWCQQFGTSEFSTFIEMNERMERYYKENKYSMVARTINFGSCYVVYHENHWFRVRALSSVPKEGLVNCFLIDIGEDCQITTSNVFHLKREFALQQAQAFVCRLHGLEELYSVSAGSEVLQSLLTKQVMLEIVAEEGSERELSIPVVMYGTNGRPINEDLITALTMESATPILAKSTITEVYVSNIESNGDVYVQIHTPGYQRLLEMLDQLGAAITENPPTNIIEHVTQSNSKGRLYLIHDRAMGRWLRATLIDWAPSQAYAQVYFVDYGHAIVAKVSEETIYPLDRLHDVVSKYPPQAVKVRIMIESVTSDFVQKASRLMSKDQVVLLKIVSFDNENVAWVEFFKRSNDGGLFCVNKSIAVEAELQNIDAANNNDRLSRQRVLNLTQSKENSIKNVPSGGCLMAPFIPEKGTYFNVNVPFAVNPWNFFVQPLDTFDQLTNLMEDMQNRYKDYYRSSLPIEEVMPGNIYASKHEDGRWYRTSVLKVIHSGSISVFYCDFGFYTNLKIDQLVPLDPKYMKLPYQALKAKLSGIKPMKNKWSVDDCEIFRNLVTKKQFVSVLVDTEKDELYKLDNVLSLLLIDTTTDVDVHVREELVRIGVAKKA